MTKTRNAPSAARLMKTFHIDQAAADQVRATIKAAKSAHAAITEIAQKELIGGYGDEVILKDAQYYGRDHDGNIRCSYINMGDTYNATLLGRGNAVSIGCWGDVAERFTT